LSYYIKFHSYLLTRRNEILVIDFLEVVNDMPSVIKRINRQFDTNFHSFSLCNENTKKIKAIVHQMDAEEIKKYKLNVEVNKAARVAVPSKERDLAKLPFFEKIESTPKLNSLLCKANEIYFELMKTN
jgi:vacuolar-type H+-ATPase subunit D/Vma8